MTTAKDLLRPVTSVRETVTVRELLQLLGQDGYFAVVDAEGRLSGLVTEYDLVKLVYESGQIADDAIIASRPAYLGYSREQLLALTADDIMTNDPETVPPTAGVDEVVSRVFKNRRKVLLVAEDGIVAGAVLRRDLLRKVLG